MLLQSGPPFPPIDRRRRQARRRRGRAQVGKRVAGKVIGLTHGRWVAEDRPGVLPTSGGGGGTVVARLRALEFRRGRGRDRPMCCTGSFTGV
jgi:hypothetical protein